MYLREAASKDVCLLMENVKTNEQDNGTVTQETVQIVTIILELFTQ